MDDRGATTIGVDGATFAPERLVADGRRPILPVAMALTMGALVAVGWLGERTSTGDGGRDAGRSATATARAARHAGTPFGLGLSNARDRPAVPGALGDRLIRLDVREADDQLFVHGDLFRLDVILVVVSIEDAPGHVAAIESLDIAGGSTAFRIGANPRFSVAFELPASPASAALWIHANAYDRAGAIVASTRVPFLQGATRPAPDDPAVVR
jgi:hypothetical protein